MSLFYLSQIYSLYLRAVKGKYDQKSSYGIKNFFVWWAIQNKLITRCLTWYYLIYPYISHSCQLKFEWIQIIIVIIKSIQTQITFRNLSFLLAPRCIMIPSVHMHWLNDIGARNMRSVTPAGLCWMPPSRSLCSPSSVSTMDRMVSSLNERI